MQVIDDETVPTESVHNLQELYPLRVIEVVEEESSVYDVERVRGIGGREGICRFDLDVGAKRGRKGVVEVGPGVSNSHRVGVEAHCMNGAVEAIPSTDEMTEVVSISTSEIENSQFGSISEKGVDVSVGT